MTDTAASRGADVLDYYREYYDRGDTNVEAAANLVQDVLRYIGETHDEGLVAYVIEEATT